MIKNDIKKCQARHCHFDSFAAVILNEEVWISVNNSPNPSLEKRGRS